MKAHGEAGREPHARLYGFDIFFFCYLFLESILIACHRQGIPEWSGLLVKNLVILLSWCFFWVAGEGRRRGVIWFIRNCYLCAALPILFTEVKYIIHLVNPVDLDPMLSRIDYALFGVHPGVWLEQYVHPVLTTLLQICYLSYFPLILPVGLYFYFRKREEFAPFITAVALMFFLTLLGYLAVPALGPRKYLAHLFTIPVEGLGGVQALISAMDQAEGISRDCFPSGHTAMAVLTILATWRHARFLFPAYLAVGSGLMLSAVYLRYHYVIDLPAGAAVAVFSLWAGRWINRRVEEIFTFGGSGASCPPRSPGSASGSPGSSNS